MQPIQDALENQIHSEQTLRAHRQSLAALELMSRAVDGRFATMKDRVCRDIDLLLSSREALYATIQGLNNPLYQTILSLRYFCGFTWDQIAEQTHYSSRHVQRLHKKALEAISGPVRKKKGKYI